VSPTVAHGITDATQADPPIVIAANRGDWRNAGHRAYKFAQGGKPCSPVHQISTEKDDIWMLFQRNVEQAFDNLVRAVSKQM
jgi:hypothetical protein